MKCPICNYESSDDSKFCCGCGRPFPCCPTCGNVITTHDRFCMHCGTRLPEELLLQIPEEEVVEQVDVVKCAEPVVSASFVETVRMPAQKPQTPTAHPKQKQTANLCASCNMPCEPGEEYCSYCRPSDPVPVADMDYIPAKPPKKKKGSAFTAILVILLLLLIGAAAALVAAEFDLIELPDIFSADDSGSDRRKDRDRGDKNDDADTDVPAGDTVADAPIDEVAPETEPATTAATVAPTQAATEAPTEAPTQSNMTKLEYFMENCDSMIFSKADIAGFTKAEARYARNACYAQGGRKFKDKDLQAYFEQYDWYTPTYEPTYFDQHDSELMNKYMKENLKLIREYEKEMGFG